MSLSKELVGASTIPMILAILAREDSYGYAIIREVREASLGELEWTEGMLYPVLHRLERQRLIRSEWRASDSGRKRKYYSILKAGRTALSEGRQQWRVVQSTLDRLWEAQQCST